MQCARTIDTCQCVCHTVRMPANIASATERHGSLLVADLGSCCGPITDGVLDTAAAERLAGVLKALAEPTRLRLVSLIAGHDGAEACVCDLTAPVGLTQPTVSHHLKVLVEAGLLERTQRGKWAYYRLAPAALDALAGVFAHTGSR
ncbi:Arsenic resistance transcriptional regulator ArsR1 [Mycobacterium talmoniae]|uniref:Arsenic resistance transcriptional regulator ArsR1 n=2 Tax=Mycobacterium talmoniae TaxID=1858794 RepID=A0A2S8BNT9_9MYCO|nr:Arsenic resistance transcriptional regulator ArsR1 [Mycobacterium talmoniae]